jgi:hypothetical protein
MVVLSFRKKYIIEKMPVLGDDVEYYRLIGNYFRNHPGIKWSQFIPIPTRPICYLEIGVCKGENLMDISKSYCVHPDSRMVCVDPWFDYDEYPEYKGKQSSHYEQFIANTSQFADKCIIHRGLSEDIVPTLDSFDIIYIDGNHEEEYVYRDGVMSFPKLKQGGYLIFDDYHPYAWPQTCRGIDRWLREYASKIKIISNATFYWQVIVQKI